MDTEIIKIDLDNIDMYKLQHAADVLKRGGLVAFPTETVYGIGANALDEASVKKIYEAKGRPSDNPLIVHIADTEALCSLVEVIPYNFHSLKENFWPGPLTMIMKKSKLIPDIITGGLDTVAVRMPSHPVALALIRLSGLPVAAPSANLSGKPSPTSAKHVIDDLSGRVDIIIDAGDSDVGVESTVLDLTSSVPMILRPGGITSEALNIVIGKVGIDPALSPNNSKCLKPKSPGMKYRHYSPKADLCIVDGELDTIVAKIKELSLQYLNEGVSVGILATEQTKGNYSSGEILSMGDRNHPETLAANLFKALREFDKRNVKQILAESVDKTGIGLAIMNRMTKAAGYNIIKADKHP